MNVTEYAILTKSGYFNSQIPNSETLLNVDPDNSTYMHNQNQVCVIELSVEVKLLFMAA